MILSNVERKLKAYSGKLGAMDGWTTRSCEANGIRIHYLRTGGDKPPVVLLHGLLTSGACWASLAEALEEDYDVIMPDARGHGHSSAPEQGYTYDTLAADVLGFIEALKLTNPILLGHSMGGMTAALAASLNPTRLRSVVLADPTFLTPERQREVYARDIAAQHREILNRSKEDFLAELRTRHTHRSPELIESFAQARYQTSIHAFEILKPPNPNYTQLIHDLALPSLLVIGGPNAIISPAMATEFTKINPRLAVAQIEEAGHGIPYDQPDRFSTVVKAFLAR